MASTQASRQLQPPQLARRSGTARALVAEITNRRYGVKRRVAAIASAGAMAVKRPQLMTTLLALIADPEEKVEVRQAALSVVEAGSFKTVEFRRYAADYHAALRVAATDDDAGLRSTVLDLLALENDPYAQQLLLDGLREPRQALVKPVQAIRMLGYDVHAEHYPVLREIVETSKQQPVRREALRLLAADSDSRALMRQIATDRDEDKQARATAAVALQSLAPNDFAKVAKTVVLDDDDDDDLRATVITAIAHGPTKPGRDVERKVRQIDAAAGGTRQLNRAARDFTAARPARRTSP